MKMKDKREIIPIHQLEKMVGLGEVVDLEEVKVEEEIKEIIQEEEEESSVTRKMMNIMI